MKRRSSLVVITIVTITTVICLILILGGWYVTNLPKQAKNLFGPPATNIQALQLTYLSWVLLSQTNDLTMPHDPYGLDRPFLILLDESTFAITDRLQKEGFIPNLEAFRTYLVYAGLDTTLQAGEYQLSPRMTPIEIAQALQDATPTELIFHILPGWRLEEIAESIPTSGLSFTPEDFLVSVTLSEQDSPLIQELPAGASLEGFLYPDNYRFPRDITTQIFIATLLENFQIKVDSELRDGFQRQGLPLFQAVTLASIVQREAVIEDETPLIASVFLNRIASGIKLETDPTVQYALGYNPAQNTWWTNPLSVEDLQIDSPYNTYLYPGLPPGPIANPSLNALKAVAFPAQTPYYFFRSACDGSGRHTFAETFEEHLNNECP
jgi:UPF0755 protein